MLGQDVVVRGGESMSCGRIRRRSGSRFIRAIAASLVRDVLEVLDRSVANVALLHADLFLLPRRTPGIDQLFGFERITSGNENGFSLLGERDRFFVSRSSRVISSLWRRTSLGCTIRPRLQARELAPCTVRSGESAEVFQRRARIGLLIWKGSL